MILLAVVGRLAEMPRGDEAGGVYQALNRATSRATIFRNDAHYEAFEHVLGEGLARHAVDLFSYQLMPSHWRR